MFASIKNMIPEPRQADQPRHYVGRHREPEAITTPTEANSPSTVEEGAPADLPAVG